MYIFLKIWRAKKTFPKVPKKCHKQKKANAPQSNVWCTTSECKQNRLPLRSPDSFCETFVLTLYIVMMDQDFLLNLRVTWPQNTLDRGRRNPWTSCVTQLDNVKKQNDIKHFIS